MIQFDHIEVHVKDSERYVNFLVSLFGGGRFKRISDNNTYMFLSIDNIRIEVKERSNYLVNIDLENAIGFCLPCLRMKGAKNHLLSLGNIEITKELENPDGAVIFFKDYEGVDWHIKDYEIFDIYTNI